MSQATSTFTGWDEHELDLYSMIDSSDHNILTIDFVKKFIDEHECNVNLSDADDGKLYFMKLVDSDYTRLCNFFLIMVLKLTLKILKEGHPLIDACDDEKFMSKHKKTIPRENRDTPPILNNFQRKEYEVV